MLLIAIQVLFSWNVALKVLNLTVNFYQQAVGALHRVVLSDAVLAR